MGWGTRELLSLSSHQEAAGTLDRHSLDALSRDAAQYPSQLDSFAVRYGVRGRHSFDDWNIQEVPLVGRAGRFVVAFAVS